MSTDTISKTAPTIKPLPHLERLQELLDYDPETGVFWWKVSRGRVSAGSIAGYLNARGYHVIGIDGLLFRSHRLAWKMMTGDDPGETIDHKNNKCADNRFENLRLATRSQQRWNVTASGKSKFLGVCWNKNRAKWQASIKRGGKYCHLGLFTCEKEAARAYDAAAAGHHGEFANLNFPGGS